MLWQRFLLYALAHTTPEVDYEQPPAGYPNGFAHPGNPAGSPYPMPGLLGGLPMGRRHQQVPFNSNGGGWAYGGYVPAHPGALPDGLHHQLPPPPYRFDPMSVPSMPQPVFNDWVGAPSDSSWPHAEFIGNFVPPATAGEENAQLQLAIECSRHDHHRQPIETFIDHLDQHASASDRNRPARFNDLPGEIRGVYANEFEYEQEVTASLMYLAPVEAALGKAGLQAIPNDGRTGESINNCFLISVTQHMCGEYDSSHDERVGFMRRVLDGDQDARTEARELSSEHRRILDNAPEVRLGKNAKVSSRGAEARLAVDLMNANRTDEDRIDVWIVSMVDGQAHVDKLESGSPSARVVAIWDKGGHFEAITSIHQPPR
jgi:hypothetical protein